MRLVMVSDTHGLHDRLVTPDGDVLIHAGDMVGDSNLQETADFLTWFAAQPHPHRILVAGNHDFLFERQPEIAEKLVRDAGVTYLRDSGVTIGGVKFWGSPWTPWFYDWAFNAQRGEEIARHWALIPLDTQVLITHGPPSGMLDEVVSPRGKHVGCEALRVRIAELEALRVHCCGHIHEGAGTAMDGVVTYVNACSVDENYALKSAPAVIDL